MTGTDENPPSSDFGDRDAAATEAEKHSKKKKKSKKGKKDKQNKKEASISKDDDCDSSMPSADRTNSQEKTGEAAASTCEKDGFSATEKKAAIEDGCNENGDGDGKETTKESKMGKKKEKNKKKSKKKRGKPKESGSDCVSGNDELARAGSESGEKKEGEAKPSEPTDDNDEDEDELLAAAAAWAGDDDDDDDDNDNNNKPTTTKDPSRVAERPQKFSLHITQLPYDSTDYDLRKLFMEQGCAMSSIRLVYDRDPEGRKTLFRGVAFVDFADESSYDRARKLHHKTSIRGRKLNIRPCRSREELAEIVARTEELVKEKIRKQREKDDDDKNNNNNNTATTTNAGSRSNKSNSNSKKDKTKKSKPSASSSPPKSGKGGGGAATTNNNKRKADNNNGANANGDKSKKPRLGKDGKPIKLTKKERNRRAAIIMQKRRRQRK